MGYTIYPNYLTVSGTQAAGVIESLDVVLENLVGGLAALEIMLGADGYQDPAFSAVVGTILSYMEDGRHRCLEDLRKPLVDSLKTIPDRHFQRAALKMQSVLRFGTIEQARAIADVPFVVLNAHADRVLSASTHMSPDFHLTNGEVRVLPNRSAGDGKQACSYNIRTSEREMESVLKTLAQWSPEILKALVALTPVRSSTAVLSVTLGTEDVNEVYIELQSAEGGVWSKSVQLAQSQRKTLVEWIESIHVSLLTQGFTLSVKQTEQAEELARLLAGAENVVVLTGAGISEESGVPTFRGAGGLWKEFNQRDLATPEAFAKNPERVWGWYAHRREEMGDAIPNRAHRILAELERKIPSVKVITQNIDGLHQEGGSQNVVEYHGSIWRTRCTQCQDVQENKAPTLSIPPQCKKCDGLLRPDIVMFGEMLDARNEELVARAIEHADLFISIGTSGTVQPAASLALEARRRGVKTIEINSTRPKNVSSFDLRIRAKAGDVLAAVLNYLQERT
ncbi:MAG: NAD-dependent deacylase [Deltaproteobacteria bacterium]|nr:NAD-dependent deacylase [Deltaproteobacteria bacterium]